MTNKPKAIGTSWETEVTRFLNEGAFGFQFERVGSRDYGAGDIHGGDWVIEAKNENKLDLPGYLTQLKREVERNDFEPLKSLVFVKNRRHQTKDGYAVMSIGNMRTLMAYVEVLEGLVESQGYLPDVVRVFEAAAEIAALDNGMQEDSGSGVQSET